MCFLEGPEEWTGNLLGKNPKNWPEFEYLGLELNINSLVLLIPSHLPNNMLMFKIKNINVIRCARNLLLFDLLLTTTINHHHDHQPIYLFMQIIWKWRRKKGFFWKLCRGYKISYGKWENWEEQGFFVFLENVLKWNLY